MDTIVHMLAQRYGLTARTVYEVPGGWSAKAYRVDGERGAYFLKEYERRRPSIQPWVRRIDDYMPVLGRLAEVPELREHVLHPLATREGTYKVETAEHVYVLFTYVEGETPGKKGLSEAQAGELAQILARLHRLGQWSAGRADGLLEEYALPCCAGLRNYMARTTMEREFDRLLLGYKQLLLQAIAETLRLRDSVRLQATELVLCHGDAHPFNVIQSDRLVVVDWEDLRWAPAELDLILYALTPQWNAFWRAYQAARPDFRLNKDLMRFYLLRRRLDDIWSDALRLSREEPSAAETAQMLGWTRQAATEITRIQGGGAGLSFA